MKHWVYRYEGNFAGLCEDMDAIIRRAAPGTEVINVQQVGDVKRHRRGYEPTYEYLIYTRTP